MVPARLKSLFGWRAAEPSPMARAAGALYGALVAAARREAFYMELGVPDTIDGRFELVIAHLFLVLDRLGVEGAAGEELGRRLMEVMVEDFDVNLREMGSGDSGVGRRMKTMLRGARGRLEAYGRALEAADRRGLEAVLDNNLYGTVLEVEPAALAAMAGYLVGQSRALRHVSMAELTAGRVDFAPPPTLGA